MSILCVRNKALITFILVFPSVDIKRCLKNLCYIHQHVLNFFTNAKYRKLCSNLKLAGNKNHLISLNNCKLFNYLHDNQLITLYRLILVPDSFDNFSFAAKFLLESSEIIGKISTTIQITKN